MEQTWCQCLNLKESESVQTERKKIMVESKEEDKSENLGEKIDPSHRNMHHLHTVRRVRAFGMYVKITITPTGYWYGIHTYHQGIDAPIS